MHLRFINIRAKATSLQMVSQRMLLSVKGVTKIKEKIIFAFAFARSEWYWYKSIQSYQATSLSLSLTHSLGVNGPLHLVPLLTITEFGEKK